MKEKYEIENNRMRLVFNKNIYSIIAIKRVLSNYTNNCFIKIEEEQNDTIVLIRRKKDTDDLKSIAEEIYNRVLEEDVRCTIECQTKKIRELMYDKAMNVVNNECE